MRDSLALGGGPYHFFDRSSRNAAASSICSAKRLLQLGVLVLELPQPLGLGAFSSSKNDSSLTPSALVMCHSVTTVGFPPHFWRCDYEELLDFNFSGLRASNGGPGTRDGICIDKCLYKYQIVFLGAGHGFCGF
jgi:hypothetical protein